jgi:ABC-2 type transport system ATP-binding protein
MIRVQDLTKSYGPHHALKGISFDIPQGQVVGFLGVNGAGKTTTMRILTGYYQPTSGGVWINGHSVVKEPDAVKRSIGYLPETPPLYPEMTVESYLKFVLELKKVPKASRKEFLEWTLEKCGLKDRRSSIIGHLSKGYRQRVGIAQAVIHRPAVIILDEPTVGLDPMQIKEIRNLIRDFKGQHTLLLSTHILSEVVATCERVLIVHRGRIASDQLIQDVMQRESLEDAFQEVITRDEAEELEQSHLSLAAQGGKS